MSETLRFLIASKLNSLRNAQKDRIITAENFNLLSATLYLELGFHLRAETLLNRIVSDTMTDTQKKQFTYLQNACFQQKKLHGYPPLSLCMIVKNEEDSIRNVLQDADVFIDEIIIIDTGSTDKTIETAHTFGTVVKSSPWKNDFSFHRNESLELAHGTWILWLDADDRVSNDSMLKIRNLCRKPAQQAYLFQIKNTADKNNPEICNYFSQCRLFPNNEKFRFIYPIHEQITPSLKNNAIGFTVLPEIEIIHTGYADSVKVQGKAKRNIDILENAIEHNPEEQCLVQGLADSYYAIGKRELAYRVYSRIVRINFKKNMENIDICTQALVNMAQIRIDGFQMTKGKKLYSLCLSLDPNKIEALYGFALCEEKLKKYDNAISFYKKVLQTHSQLRLTATDYATLRHRALYNLCECLLIQKRCIEAEKLILAGNELYPHQPHFLSLLGKINEQKRNEDDAFYYYMRSIRLSPENNDDSFEGLLKLSEPHAMPQ